MAPRLLHARALIVSMTGTSPSIHMKYVWTAHTNSSILEDLEVPLSSINPDNQHHTKETRARAPIRATRVLRQRSRNIIHVTNKHIQLRESLHRRSLRRRAMVAALASLVARLAALLRIPTAVRALQQASVGPAFYARILAVAASLLVAALV